MTLVNWIITGVVAWLTVGTLAAILIGRIARGRDRQVPSPKHPTMRAHKQHVTDRPLTEREAATIVELEKQFTPDTQESQ